MIDGYVALFLSALLAATIVPFSSEALLGGMLLAGAFDPVRLWAVASLGNTLGAAVNWALGRFCLRWQDHRWFPAKRESVQRAGVWFARYGVWSLLFAWVPIVGDPLTFVAGALRVQFWKFLLLVAIGKAGRYAVVIYALAV